MCRFITFCIISSTSKDQHVIIGVCIDAVTAMPADGHGIPVTLTGFCQLVRAQTFCAGTLKRLQQREWGSRLGADQRLRTSSWSLSVEMVGVPQGHVGL